MEFLGGIHLKIIDKVFEANKLEEFSFTEEDINEYKDVEKNIHMLISLECPNDIDNYMTLSNLFQLSHDLSQGDARYVYALKFIGNYIPACKNSWKIYRDFMLS